MAEIQKSNSDYIETDKWYAPYLLASSFQGLISLKGHYSVNGVVHWIFNPKDKAELLIDQLQTKTEPHIPTQDLFLAIQTFWEKVSSYKKLS